MSSSMSTMVMMVVILATILCCCPCGRGILVMNSADRSLLAMLHQRFQPVFTANYRPHANSVQFTVLSFNRAGTSSNTLSPCNLVMNQEPETGGNYLAATVLDLPSNLRWHAEMRAISDVMDWIEQNGVPNTIHIYSYLFPCPDCARWIRLLANTLPQTSIYIGYNVPHGTQQDHANTLFTLFGANNIAIEQINVNCVQPRDELRRSITCSNTLVSQGTCQMSSQESFDVYLLDTSSYKYMSVTAPCNGNDNGACIGATKDKPDADSKMKLILLRNGRVALQGSNGKYLSRIAYDSSAVSVNNYIQPLKSSIDVFSQFRFEYARESGGVFNNISTIALKADNGRYLAPHSGTTIKPLATMPFKYAIFLA